MHRRILLATLAAAASAGLAAPPAQAGIWTATPSGTTQDIMAVDYAAADRLLVATAGGQILRNGAVELNAPGASFTDIAMNPAGTIGLATANNGVLYRSIDGGDSWVAVSLASTTRNHTCPGSGGPYGAATPTGNLVGVSWASDSTAYVAGADRGVVLKTTNAGATWSDTSRQSDGTCRADPGFLNAFSDVFALPGTSNLTLVTDNFGQRRFSSNGLASSATAQNDSSVNCPDDASRITVDPSNPNRVYVVGRCPGSLSFGTSEDGGTTFDLSREYRPDSSGDGLNGMYDVAIAGGSAIAVGNSGRIFIAPDTVSAYFQPADGVDATNDWRAVDKLDATRAAVGGRNGRLLMTTQATTLPDLSAPTGSVVDPGTVVAGQPVTLTASVTDEPGGSGVDASGFSWSGGGVSGTSNPVTVTFANPGFYTVKVTFRDLAGNVGQATRTINVQSATPPPPPPAPPAPTPDFATIGYPGVTYPGPTRNASTSDRDKTIRFGVPRHCVRPGQKFRVRLTWTRKKRKGNLFVKVRRSDFYIGTRRVKIDRKAPFSQLLTVRASTRKGSTIRLRARAFIKVRRGKSPTKSIVTTIRVCN